MIDIRALTVKQPWASLIAARIKPVENRTWPIPRTWQQRGQLLIHAGAAFDRMSLLHPEVRSELEAQSWPEWPLPAGMVVAVAGKVDCHRAAAGCCTSHRYGEPEGWHWVLADVRELPRPVPAKGRLGLWRPDADLLAAVEAQYSEMDVAW